MPASSATAKATRCLLGAVVLAACCASSLAQVWPSKPLRLIVPFPPGGGADLVLRQMGPRLTEKFGQQVVIENRPGAGGNIGAELIAKAAPDGYTVGIATTATLCINPSLPSRAPFDPARDFRPVALVATIPFFLVAHPSMPANSVRELIALAKANPGKLSYGHAGNGTLLHLSGELLKMMAGVDIVAVPYKGGAPAAVAAVSGEVPLAIVELPPALANIRAGKLKALGVTTARRIAAAPDVPSIAESGLPEYDTMGWFGVVAPAATPIEIVNRWNAEIVAILKLADMRERMNASGTEPAPSTPSEFDALIKSETLKWARLIRTGVKMTD